MKMIESAEEFVRLRTSDVKDEYDRAAHDDAPPEVWWELVRDHPDMKIWVVANKTVPLAVLEALSTDDDPSVRDAVARKRRASPEILERLARDPDSGVRYAVACNPKAPRGVLNLMLADEWDVVAEKARARLESGS
jgi:hypothetical protein